MVELGLLSVADGFDDVGGPGLAVDAVQFGGFDQGVDDGCMIAGPVIAKKQKILPPKMIFFTARSDALLSMLRRPSLRCFRSFSNYVIA